MVYRGFVTSDDGGQPAVSDARRSPTKHPSLVFVFNGQGAQWAGMAAELLQIFPSFRSSIRRMDLALMALDDPPSWTIIGTTVPCCSLAVRNDADEEDSDTLANTAGCWTSKAEFVQPLCTALQIGLVDVLAEWNIRPATVVGHSSGEIAAAYAMGSLTAEEAITIAFYHGKLVSSLPVRGAMAAIGLNAQEAEEFLVEGAVIACENSPQSVTISGDVDMVEAVAEKIKLSRPDTFYRRLRFNIAYHSRESQFSLVYTFTNVTDTGWK